MEKAEKTLQLFWQIVIQSFIFLFRSDFVDLDDFLKRKNLIILSRLRWVEINNKVLFNITELNREINSVVKQVFEGLSYRSDIRRVYFYNKIHP